MAAERTLQRRRISGQSLIEFVLILPVMAGMLFLMVRVSATIQVSIVNQRYARQRILELADNAANYPKLRFLRGNFIERKSNRMVVGVSEETTDIQSSGEAEILATAPTLPITSRKQLPGSNENQMEPDTRSIVRVRNTVELCTPYRVAKSGTGGAVEINTKSLTEGTATSVAFCRSGG